MSTQTGVVDYLKRGAHDDGDEGTVLTKQTAAHKVDIPLGTAGTVQTGSSGTASVTFAATSPYNSDGTGRQATLSVPALTAGASGDQGCYLEQTVYGPTVGVRFRRDTSSVFAFTVVVDGVAYAVRNVNPRHDSATSGISYSDHEARFLIADDLGPGAHTVHVSLAADQVGGAQRDLVLYGFIGDRAAGYADRRRLGVWSASVMQAMPTAETAIVVKGMGGLRKLHWYNSDTAPHTVTVRFGAGSANNFKVITVAAGAHAEYDFGEPVAAAQTANTAFLKWLSDSALVFYTVQEAA